MALLVGGEGVHDALDGVGGAGGVQGGKNQLGHFGGVHSRADGVGVAHLAEQDDVGTLTHGGAQRLGIGGDVGGNLALGHDAGAVAVNVFDRIFHRDDVALAVVVHAVDQAGEGGRFAGARGAGDKHKALGDVGQAHNRLGDVHFLGAGQAEGDNADNRAVGAALAEDVGAEAADAGNGEAEVVIVVDGRLEDADVAIGQLVDGLHVLARVGGSQRSGIGAHVNAARVVGQRQARVNEDVRCLKIDHLLQKFLQFHVDDSPLLVVGGAGPEGFLGVLLLAGKFPLIH